MTKHAVAKAWELEVIGGRRYSTGAPPGIDDSIIVAGDPYFSDDADYAIARNESHSSKFDKVEARGWAEIWDRQVNSNLGGDIFTATQEEVAETYAYTGHWPAGVNRCFVFDGNPNDGTFDPGIGARQTNYYLHYIGIRPVTVHEFGLVLFSQRADSSQATRSRGDKWLYWADFTEETDNHGFDLTVDGKCSYEDSNPAQSAGDRDDFYDSSAPNNRSYVGYRAAGLSGNAVMENTNSTSPGDQTHVLYQNADLGHQAFDEFVWWRYIRDISGAQAKFTIRARRPGQAWVTVAHYEGGVTPGFSHPIPLAFRTAETQLKFPTTQNQYPGSSGTTSDGAHARGVFCFGLYDSEADCPVRADEP